VKSGPASFALAPLRLICITPSARSPERIGVLMIFWMASALSGANFTPSKTLACFTEVKSLMISGRLSRMVRAASADLLDSGMKPTFFSASGTMKSMALELSRFATINGASDWKFRGWLLRRCERKGSSRCPLQRWRKKCARARRPLLLEYLRGVPVPLPDSFFCPETALCHFVRPGRGPGRKHARRIALLSGRLL
jgi:hypothetical protein